MWCVCVSFFGPFIQWRKISHLAFKVVNVCQNELAFKIYIFMGFTTSSLPFFAYALLLSSFSKCVWLCVCMKVYVWVCTLHVCPMLPSFSLHSENFGGLFNMNIFVWVPECVCVSVSVAQFYFLHNGACAVCSVCNMHKSLTHLVIFRSISIPISTLSVLWWAHECAVHCTFLSIHIASGSMHTHSHSHDQALLIFLFACLPDSAVF